jgi:hypothetical protein
MKIPTMTTSDIGNGNMIEIVMLIPKDIPIQISWLRRNCLLSILVFISPHLFQCFSLNKLFHYNLQRWDLKGVLIGLGFAAEYETLPLHFSGWFIPYFSRLYDKWMIAKHCKYKLTLFLKLYVNYLLNKV